MELLTPGTGLIFWQAVVFLLLVGVLSKFAWKPIIAALDARESFIEKSLQGAEEAQDQLKKNEEKREALIAEAHTARDKLLKKAQIMVENLHTKAKEDAQQITDKMVDDAKIAIQAEKQAAKQHLQQLVAQLAVQVSEKVLREQLDEKTTARTLIEKYVKELPTITN